MQSQLAPRLPEGVETSDSLTDHYKRKILAEHENAPPRKLARCDQGRRLRMVRMNKQTMSQIKPCSIDVNWAGLFQCRECDKPLPGKDLWHARCDGRDHQIMICVDCFKEKDEEATLASTPKEKQEDQSWKYYQYKLDEHDDWDSSKWQSRSGNERWPDRRGEGRGSSSSSGYPSRTQR